MIVDLYLESHVTLKPFLMDDPMLEKIDQVAAKYKFKRAKLLMQKGDQLIPSSYDTFLTGHSKDTDDIEYRTVNLVKELLNIGVDVWRYKIENTLCNSRTSDIYCLLQDK